MKYIKINPADNVAVAIEALPAGAEGTVEDIPAGHKFALTDIKAGEDVIKYGYPIGHAIVDIPRGGWVNEKRLKTNLDGVLEYVYEPVTVGAAKQSDIITDADPQYKRTFLGYRRANGLVGIRNEIWIIPTVGCVNGIANRVAERLRAETGCDAITAFGHNYGCSQLGDDHENTRKILRDMILHPNAGGVLIIGLGCENNQVSALQELVGEVDESRIKFVETQKVEGDELNHCLKLAREIFEVTQNDIRTEIPVSELRIGLKCGGSDGFSGITANPLVGMFSDWLTEQGGTTILTEVPEMFGAERILMSRCENRHIFDKTVHLINDFKEYFIRNEQPIYENPSPGNKAGGISTLEEKSLGCTQKSGSAVVRDVLMYGDRLAVRGLNLLSAPGNDLVAATALAAAGCQMVLFTTGRGTPFGTFVPTLKVATNTPLAQNKPNWIDFNAGQILSENRPMEEVCNDFMDYVLAVASGKKVNNELNGYREIAIFKTGVTL